MHTHAPRVSVLHFFFRPAAGPRAACYVLLSQPVRNSTVRGTGVLAGVPVTCDDTCHDMVSLPARLTGSGSVHYSLKGREGSIYERVRTHAIRIGGREILEIHWWVLRAAVPGGGVADHVLQ